jgi:hypothetical protein
MPSTSAETPARREWLAPASTKAAAAGRKGPKRHEPCQRQLRHPAHVHSHECGLQMLPISTSGIIGRTAVLNEARRPPGAATKRALLLHRFRGRPGRREDAPGASHAETKAGEGRANAPDLELPQFSLTSLGGNWLALRPTCESNFGSARSSLSMARRRLRCMLAAASTS